MLNFTKFIRMGWIYLPIMKATYNMDSAIIPECYVDTNFIETLVPNQYVYNHKKGCGTVTAIMMGKFTEEYLYKIKPRLDESLNPLAYERFFY